MLLLPNNCRCSGTPGDPKKGIPDELPVFPKNWKSARASLKDYWYIKYRFYDDNLKKSKQIVIKAGINEYKTVHERQNAIRVQMMDELDDLKQKGLNKITKIFSTNWDDDISEHTPFLEALQYAQQRVKLARRSIQTLKTVMKYISLAAKAKHYDIIPIIEIKRRHIVLLFEQIEKIKRVPLSAHVFNTYRAYLGILYKELLKLDIVQANMAYTLEKQTIVEKIRTTLTPEQRTLINNYLYHKYPSFWRFTNIFFHSGCRETEMMQVRKEDVDLQNQLFKVTIIKGKTKREVLKVIKDIALPLWEEVMNEAKPGMYLFSKGLVPGEVPIQSYQITKRWYRLVKKPLGIEADFYAWKHLNSDETAAALDIQAAAAMNSHTSTVITLKHYAKGESKRQRELLKKVNNKLA